MADVPHRLRGGKEDLVINEAVVIAIWRTSRLGRKLRRGERTARVQREEERNGSYARELKTERERREREKGRGWRRMLRILMWRPSLSPSSLRSRWSISFSTIMLAPACFHAFITVRFARTITIPRFFESLPGRLLTVSILPPRKWHRN